MCRIRASLCGSWSNWARTSATIPSSVLAAPFRAVRTVVARPVWAYGHLCPMRVSSCGRSACPLGNRSGACACVPAPVSNHDARLSIRACLVCVWCLGPPSGRENHRGCLRVSANTSTIAAHVHNIKKMNRRNTAIMSFAIVPGHAAKASRGFEPRSLD